MSIEGFVTNTAHNVLLQGTLTISLRANYVHSGED